MLEAQRLTTWWTETQSMCSSNFGLMVKYIRQYWCTNPTAAFSGKNTSAY